MSEETNKENKLAMTFDPQTIEHLGVKMYSQLPNAIAEIIANSYDAEALNVHIKLTDTDTEKSIAIVDDGIGMSFDEVNENFLRIGRKRREEDNGMSPNGLRKVAGRKGLGKLAFFGIGDTIRIITKSKGKCVDFSMNWNEILHSKTHNYEPKYTVTDCDPANPGTTIVLTDLKRKTGFNVEELASSISRLFNCFSEDFAIDISLNGSKPLEVNEKLRYNTILSQFLWNIPQETDIQYFQDKGVRGQLLATEKPLKPGLRGITLYAHGRMVNAPEFFGVGESSHFYSYLTGWLDVDFVDEQDEDIISTDRQSLSWDLPITEELKSNLKQLLSSIERDWREKRKNERKDNIKKKTNIDVSVWYPTLAPQIKDGVEKIVNSVIENSEMEGEKQNEVVGMLHTLIPEYAQYHWRRLHTSVQDASYEDYKRKDFYRAIAESIKRYEHKVQEKAEYPKDAQGRLRDGQSLMQSSFGSLLSVTSKYHKKDNSNFTPDTINNIEQGQQFLSAGIMAEVRNPLAHEEIVELRDSGLFTENDCLDMLSLLSHLFRRLDDAVKK